VLDVEAYFNEPEEAVLDELYSRCKKLRISTTFADHDELWLETLGGSKLSRIAQSATLLGSN
jgi:hypothetical protein